MNCVCVYFFRKKIKREKKTSKDKKRKHHRRSSTSSSDSEGEWVEADSSRTRKKNGTHLSLGSKRKRHHSSEEASEEYSDVETQKGSKRDRDSHLIARQCQVDYHHSLKTGPRDHKSRKGDGHYKDLHRNSRRTSDSFSDNSDLERTTQTRRDLDRHRRHETDSHDRRHKRST